MYRNVIVPFDGTAEGRAGLAVASDLAWRAGAKVVIVNNTAAGGRATKEAIKSRAMSLSGADVDFWVDTNPDLGEALVETARFREDPIVCLSTKTRSGSVLARRWSLSSVAEVVLRSGEAPALVVGPETDTSRGLPMTELVVATDGSEASEAVLDVAVAWAREFKLSLVVLGVISVKQREDTGERRFLTALVDSMRPELSEVSYELVRATDPATGIVEFVAQREDAVLAMTTYGKSGPRRAALGPVALKTLARSRRCILFLRPDPGT